MIYPFLLTLSRSLHPIGLPTIHQVKLTFLSLKSIYPDPQYILHSLCNIYPNDLIHMKDTLLYLLIPPPHRHHFTISSRELKFQDRGVAIS